MQSHIAWYQQHDFSFFPLPLGSKQPFPGWNWKPLQTRQPRPQEVAAWFGAPCNVAVVTGRVSGNLCVLDFDDMDTFPIWFEDTHLETRVCYTGKGVHLYFRVSRPVKNGNFYVGGTLAGQVRFDGGYVVAPPSLHPSGRRYAWMDDRAILTVDPAALRLGTSPDHAWQPVPRKDAPTPITQASRYATVAMQRECDRVRQTPTGARNNALFRAALKLKKYQATLGDAAVLQALCAAARDAGLLEQEAVNTIHSAWRTASY